MNLPPQVVKDANSVYALVLAAGSASRFGSTKQTASFHGIPMVCRALAGATRVCGDRTLLVTGHDHEAVAAACVPFRGSVIFNPDHADGLGTSIACGVRSVRDSASAVIIMLADQPLVTTDHVQALVDTWLDSDADIVATAFADTKGPPVLFGKECFGELSGLTGDTGARALFASQRFSLKVIPFEPAAIDIDTPGDLDW